MIMPIREAIHCSSRCGIEGGKDGRNRNTYISKKGSKMTSMALQSRGSQTRKYFPSSFFGSNLETPLGSVIKSESVVPTRDRSIMASLHIKNHTCVPKNASFSSLTPEIVTKYEQRKGVGDDDRYRAPTRLRRSTVRSHVGNG